MQKFYEKYIVKSSLLFVIVVISFLSLIVFEMHVINISVIETFNGVYGDNKIIIDQRVDYKIDTAYIYKSRTETIGEVDVISLEIVDNYFTVLYFKEKTANQFEGTITVDVEKEKIRLISILLGNRRRYIEKILTNKWIGGKL